MAPTEFHAKVSIGIENLFISLIVVKLLEIAVVSVALACPETKDTLSPGKQRCFG